jgi:carbonic anhydrase
MHGCTHQHARASGSKRRRRTYHPQCWRRCVRWFIDPRPPLFDACPTYRKDALRSLIISQQMLGTREIALFHHTSCGMASCTSSEVRTRVKSSATGAGADVVDKIDFLEFTDLEDSVKDDVQWLKEHPLILAETVITGWLYHVDTGAVSVFVFERHYGGGADRGEL